MITAREAREDEWNMKHIDMCGTCYYKHKGRCQYDKSENYDEKVSDNDGCRHYILERGFFI